MTGRAASVWVLSLAFALPARAAASLTRAQALQILDRLTYGPRPGEAEALRREGFEAWLDRQLHPESIDDSACEKRLEPYRTLTMTAAQLADEYPNKRRRRTLGLFSPTQPPRVVGEELQAAKVVRAYCSERQLNEVLVDFWFNHFNVSLRKNQDQWLTTSYERDVIRPRVWGRFRDLLGAVAHSPAMLVYLDNAQSTIDPRYAPPGAQDDIREMEDRMSMGGMKAGKPKGRAKLGLNENYARELMELHTLGVDGGYTQKDVTELARVLTGWSVAVPGPRNRNKVKDFQFVFKRRMHDPGGKVVLGQPFAWTGEQEGERALDLLARHPSTARFLARKLCRRFIADDPPASCVDAAAERFRATDGDLRETVRAVLASPAFLDPKYFRAKVKTPLEFTISALRATNAQLRDPLKVARAIGAMGQPLYMCEPPTGYPDKASAWVSSGALLARMQAAQRLFSGNPNAPAAADAALVARAGGNDGEAILRSFVEDFLGGEISGRTLAAIRARLDDPEISGSRLDDPRKHWRRGKLAALVLGSPDFQRR
jgi:uncharacterized protein (DUF1800 family)